MIDDGIGYSLYSIHTCLELSISFLINWFTWSETLLLPADSPKMVTLSLFCFVSLSFTPCLYFIFYFIIFHTRLHSCLSYLFVHPQHWVNIRIARPRNALWRAILRRAILSTSFIRIARPIYFVFLCLYIFGGFPYTAYTYCYIVRTLC